MSRTKLKIEVTIEDGKMKIKDINERKNMSQFIKNAPYGRYHLELRKKRGIRTTGQIYEISNQNGYYWGVVIPKIKEYFHSLAVEQGNNRMDMTDDEIHNGIKSLFLNDGMFSGFPKIKSTQELDKLEWEQLMKSIREHFLENYHLHIPEPNE